MPGIASRDLHTIAAAASAAAAAGYDDEVHFDDHSIAKKEWPSEKER